MERAATAMPPVGNVRLSLRMDADLNTRKPVVEITSRDLQRFPIWEYAIDEEGQEDKGKQDETWVRPVNRKAVPKGVHSQIVAARFTTPVGQELKGFMIVTTASDPVDIQPGAIVGEYGYECLPSVSRREAANEGISWAIEARDAVLHALGDEEHNVFPMRYRLQALLSREKLPRQGRVE
jgi:hypothetical protein